MKLRKLISLLATLAIAMAMVTLPVKASVNYTWHMDASAATGDANGGPIVTDLAGKGSGYTYLLKTDTWVGLTSSFAGSNLQIPDDYLTYEGYMLISMNVYSDEISSSAQVFRIDSDDGSQVTPGCTLSTGNGFTSKWNKVFLVIQLSATAANRNGYVYSVNGTKQSWMSTPRSHSLFSSSSYQNIRIRTTKANKNFYIDDVYVAFTTDALTTSELDALAAMPTLTAPSGSTVTAGSVDNVTGTVNVASGTTLSGLQSINTNKLTAYTDSTFTTPLSSNAALADGNVVIATDSLGKMSYFNVDVVGEDYSWWEMDVSAAGGDANSYKTENSLAGKEYGYTYYFKTATYFRFTNTFADASKRLTIPENYTSYEGYMLISMNIYSPAGQKFYIRDESADANNQYQITPTWTVSAANGFNINRWNKVLAVVPLSATASNRKGYIYINGVNTKNSYTKQHYLFTSTDHQQVRIKTTQSNLELYMDDVYVTFVPGTLTDAQLDALAAMPTLSRTSEAYITGNTVDVLGTTRLSDMQAGNTNNLTAYTDSAFTTPLSSSDTLADGNIVISTDSFGKMSYFDVDVDEPYVKDNGVTISNYATGTMTFGRKLYIDGEKELMIAAAQYTNSDQELINFASTTDIYSGIVDLSENLGITETAGTNVKLFIWEKQDGDYSAICNKVTFTP